MFSLSSFFKSIGNALHNFFTRNGGAIQAGIGEAVAAAGVAASVSGLLGESPDVIAEINKVADGLQLVSKSVTAASTATDLTGHAAALAGLVTGLVSSGDIGVKNAQTQAAIGVMAGKVQSVVGVLESAANVAPTA